MTYDLFFDCFYSAYPRKAAKGDARKAWAKALKLKDPASIIAAAERYRDDPNREPAFTKLPASWLRAECWDDDPLPPRPVPVNGHREPQVVKPKPGFGSPMRWEEDANGIARRFEPSVEEMG